MEGGGGVRMNKAFRYCQESLFNLDLHETSVLECERVIRARVRRDAADTVS